MIHFLKQAYPIITQKKKEGKRGTWLVFFLSANIPLAKEEKEEEKMPQGRNY